MCARAVDEPHRTATPLELLFDLTFVVAIAQLTGRLAHAIASGEVSSAFGPFLLVFFAIWWAWMNFTWFASAYDCDDAAYRLAAFVQMGGVLVLAAGIGPAFDHGDQTAVTVGYLIMRLGLVSLWVRAAIQHPRGRATASRFAVGVAVLEVLWIARLGLGDHLATTTHVVLVGLELLVPVWAQRHGETNWHPHHIAERYALFTIILLGEGLFAATTAVVAVVEEVADAGLVAVSVAGLNIVAALWWLYFSVPAGAGLEERRGWSFAWGYGHFVFFAALASLGAGLEVVVAASAGHAEKLATWETLAALAVPVAVVMAMLDLQKIPPPGARPRLEATTVVAVLALGAVVAIADRVGSTTGACLVAAITVGATAVRAAAPTRLRLPTAT
ncbi:MAG: low temperature requirement protein A [Nocardioides sp.]